LSDTASEVTTKSTSDAASLTVIDRLFEESPEGIAWDPPLPPPALGELLDSRYMLPLQFPGDPRYLAAFLGRPTFLDDDFGRSSPQSGSTGFKVGKHKWKLQLGEIREIDLNALRCLDGSASLSRWEYISTHFHLDDDENEGQSPIETSKNPLEKKTNKDDATPFTRIRKPSMRSRGRASMGGGSPT
jgi:hypothetical protein